MAWTAAHIPDLTGRVAVVTGANGGLGLETATALAGAGARVWLAARSRSKVTAARDGIRDRFPEAALDIVELDLAELASVRAAAETILGAHRTLDVLVNNAGLMAMPERTTADGFKMQFGVNHLGHFALTAHLLPALLRAESARVVTVTSTAHHVGRPVNPDNPHLTGRYTPWRAYGQAKLANYHFGIGLQHRFAEAGAAARSLIAHPGLSHTNLQNSTVAEGGTGWSGRLSQLLAARTGMSAEAGARPQLRAATDPDAAGGAFYAPRFVNFGPAVRRPVLRRLGLHRAIATLWEVSQRETGVVLDVKAAQASLRP